MVFLLSENHNYYIIITPLITLCWQNNFNYFVFFSQLADVWEQKLGEEQEKTGPLEQVKIRHLLSLEALIRGLLKCN